MSPIPHEFVDPELLRLALTHASSGRDADNERLEFLGDAVLDLIVAEDLYRALPTRPEGDLTELKAWVVSRAVLAEAARELHLEGVVDAGAGLRARALPRSVLANLYEAVLGAVYLDAGLEAAKRFTLATLAGPMSRVREARGAPNPKQTLQQLAQEHSGEPPEYVLLEQRGSAHARAFRMAAEIAGRRFPSAWGRTRKEAEKWAAHEAMLVLDGAPSA